MKKIIAASILALSLNLFATLAHAGFTGTLKIKTIGYHDTSEVVINNGVVVSGYHGDPNDPTKYAIVGGSYDGNKLVVLYQMRANNDTNYDWFSSMWVFKRRGNIFKVQKILNNSGNVMNSYSHDFQLIN